MKKLTQQGTMTTQMQMVLSIHSLVEFESMQPILLKWFEPLSMTCVRTYILLLHEHSLKHALTHHFLPEQVMSRRSRCRLTQQRCNPLKDMLSCPTVENNLPLSATLQTAVCQTTTTSAPPHELHLSGSTARKHADSPQGHAASSAALQALRS
eukprot:2325314-Amphidinium_carterae.1